MDWFLIRSFKVSEEIFYVRVNREPKVLSYACHEILNIVNCFLGARCLPNEMRYHPVTS